jgi:amino acid transporter
MILVLIVTLGLGTKKMFKIQNICFFIAMAGTVLALIVFLFGKHATFVANFNAFMASLPGVTNTYQSIAAAGQQLTAGTSMWSATIPTIVCIMTFMVWNFWSVYLSGEMKSAGQRRRQTSIMLTALIFDVVFIIIGILLIDKIAGRDFLAGVNAGADATGLPVEPYFNFFAGMISSNPLLSILIGFSFMFWNLPAMVGNTFMPIRSLFAWSFDRVLPAKLSDVNEKTHSPLWAIGVVGILVLGIFTWSIFSTSFFTLLSLGALCGVLLISVVAVSAVVMPYRRKELFETSPANIKWGKIPVLVILGVLSFAVMMFILYLLMANPAIGIAQWWYSPVFLVAVAAVGLLIYYVAKAVQKSKGIDISLAYKELPPE